MTEDPKDVIRNLVADQSGTDYSMVVAGTMFYEDLGLDDLDMVDMIMYLEELYDFTISDWDLEVLGIMNPDSDSKFGISYSPSLTLERFTDAIITLLKQCGRVS
jgi:acyl carrier protein